MKKILLLLLMSVFLVSCKNVAGFVTGDTVILSKKCIVSGKVMSEIGSKYDVLSAQEHWITIDYNGDALSASNDCFKATPKTVDKLVEAPQSDYYENISHPPSKYAVIEEYLSFEKTCKEYSKLFGLKFEKLGITSEDVLTCQGLEKEQVEQELAIIRKYLAVKRGK